MAWQPNSWIGRVRRALRAFVQAPRLWSLLTRDCPHCGCRLVAEYLLFPSDPHAWGPCPRCGRPFPLFDPRTPPERLAEVVRRLGLLGGGGIVVLPGAEVSSIRQGVLFVMATWSVQALSSFRHLNDVLSRLDLDGLKVFVADIDALTSGFDRLARGLVLGGYGETFWIRGGEVQYALSHCSPKLAGLVEQFTWAILAEGAHDPQE